MLAHDLIVKQIILYLDHELILNGIMQKKTFFLSKFWVSLIRDKRKDIVNEIIITMWSFNLDTYLFCCNDLWYKKGIT